MLSNFTVTKVEEYKVIPEGQYIAQVEHIEYVRHNFGNYIIVNWNILSPSEFEGKVHQERYQIEHDDNQVREIAINNFNKFCQSIGELKEGDNPTEDNFLYKIGKIYIRHRTGKKDGKTYTNIASMELHKPNQTKTAPHDDTKLNAVLEACGMGKMPEKPKASEAPLNDDVPF